MRVAIVHDWLTVRAGAERVLEQIINCFPMADLFAMVDFLPPEQRAFLRGKPVTTSFIQNMPGARKHYRQYLPLMPLAVEQLDLSLYDVIISSSYAVAKGVITGPDQLHVSYVHSPARYAWDLQHEYLRESGLTKGVKSYLARWMLHRFRLWDTRSANGVDSILANSRFIANRIWKTYRREAKVIHPPVDIPGGQLRETREDFYLTVSRMVPYKRVPLIVEAFVAQPMRRLVVIGEGPEFGKVKRLASANVTVLHYESPEMAQFYMQRAKAFVFAAEEDFGITPVEAQGCGCPVVGYGKGGLLETVNGLGTQMPTGVFFERQCVEDIIDAVETFEANAAAITAQACRANAMRFSAEAFCKRFRSHVEQTFAAFRRDRTAALLQSKLQAVPEARASIIQGHE